MYSKTRSRTRTRTKDLIRKIDKIVHLLILIQILIDKKKNVLQVECESNTLELKKTSNIYLFIMRYS